MKNTNAKKIIGSVALGTVMLLGATQVSASELFRPLVQAAPIWNNADAKQKCPSLQSRYNSEIWRGSWTTTAWGKMSGCWLEGLQAQQLKEQKVQARVYDSRKKYTDKCLGNTFKSVGQDICNPYDTEQVFRFDFSDTGGSELKRRNASTGVEECLVVGQATKGGPIVAGDTVSYRECNPANDSYKLWMWDAAGNLKPKSNTTVCLALAQGRVTKVIDCGATNQLTFWSPNIIAFN